MESIFQGQWVNMMIPEMKTEIYKKHISPVPYPIKSYRAHLRTVRDCPFPALHGALFEDHCAWSTISWRVLCGRQSCADSTIPWRLLRRERSCGQHTVTFRLAALTVTVDKLQKCRCYRGNLSFYYKHY